jgi:hypothetical protein
VAGVTRVVHMLRAHDADRAGVERKLDEWTERMRRYVTAG